MSTESDDTAHYWFGERRKSISDYKFWRHQPVELFDRKPDVPDGPIQSPRDIDNEPAHLDIEKAQWVTLDLTNSEEMEELYRFLERNYVEGDEMRFRYSIPLLKWVLLPPGWKSQWYVGIRVNSDLCAFFSGTPAKLRVRENTMDVAEWNFLCVHRDLRNRGLTPALFKEMTRRCNQNGVQQAVFTGGDLFPTPASSCPYYHRPLNWEKLYNVGFTFIPKTSTFQFEIEKYALPKTTKTNGLREMEAKDVDAVTALLQRQLQRFTIAPQFNETEVRHWLLHQGPAAERVIWTYVVEDGNGTITDFFSFSGVDISILGEKQSVIRIAHLFYYAASIGLTSISDRSALKIRLNALISDALILASQQGFDAFNALTIMDNTLFLQNQLFALGTGTLHYYLYNYRTQFIPRGVTDDEKLDEERGSGVGLILI